MSNRAERRRQEKLAFAKSIRPVNILDPDTDTFVEYLLANCPVCNGEQSMLIHQPTNNWHCVNCNFMRVTSEYMKKALKEFEKNERMNTLYPDESFANYVESIDTYAHADFEHLKILIHESLPNDGTFICGRLADTLRKTKLYKSYPKSATDENRLIATLYSFTFRCKYKMNLPDRSRENMNKAADKLIQYINNQAAEGEDH